MTPDIYSPDYYQDCADGRAVHTKLTNSLKGDDPECVLNQLCETSDSPIFIAALAVHFQQRASEVVQHREQETYLARAAVFEQDALSQTLRSLLQRIKNVGYTITPSQHMIDVDSGGIHREGNQQEGIPLFPQEIQALHRFEDDHTFANYVSANGISAGELEMVREHLKVHGDITVLAV